MGVEIIKTYKQGIPALRFIGKKGSVMADICYSVE
jgi:hypothetical protein